MRLSTKILIFFVLSINFSIINYFIFSPKLTLSIMIEDINESQNDIFRENDTIFSNFFDETNNLKYIFKYNSFIRIKKYHQQNKFEIISSTNLLTQNLLNDLNTYRHNEASDKNTYDFKILKLNYNKSNLYTYLFIICMTIIFLTLITKKNYEKK